MGTLMDYWIGRTIVTLFVLSVLGALLVLTYLLVGSVWRIVLAFVYRRRKPSEAEELAAWKARDMEKARKEFEASRLPSKPWLDPELIARANKEGKAAAERMDAAFAAKGWRKDGITFIPPSVDAGAPRFKSGQWVRQKATGVLARYRYSAGIVDVCEVPEDISPGGFLGFLGCQFEPAMPHEGEWWEAVRCNEHFGMPLWREAAGPRSLHGYLMERERIACGCLRPVNFGRGLPPIVYESRVLLEWTTSPNGSALHIPTTSGCVCFGPEERVRKLRVVEILEVK